MTTESGQIGPEVPRSAAIYVRISQERGDDEIGLQVERQERDCRALAARLGWTVADLYSDRDISAYNPRKRRPDYLRLLADIKAGRINAVIAWHPDRLHRQMRELEPYIDLCEEHGVENQTVTAGIWDLSTPSGRMSARVLGAAAQYESDHKSERIRAARIQHAAQGRHHGGIRCYGYEKDGLTVVPAEAAEIAAACKAVAEGASLRGIVRDMNARGVRTVTGKSWTSTQLRQTLMSPRIVGISTHRGVEVGTAAWPAIVTDLAQWRHVEKILSAPGRQTNAGRTGGVKWLGSGLYVCTCGQRTLRANVSGQPKRYTYRCINSHDHSAAHVTRDAVALDAYIEKVIVARLSKPGTVEKLAYRDDSIDVAALRVELADIGAGKDAAAQLFADGAIDAGQLAVITRGHNQRAAKITEALAQAGWRSPLQALTNGDIATGWAQLSLAQRRAILVVVADVHVLPTTPTTRGFDPRGVDIKWKIAD
jgi:DNA invertase Pin-like site-specific DNA recombinase